MTSLRALARLAALLCAALLLPAAAQAHDARPLSVTITEQEGGRHLARIKVPPSVAFDNRPVLEWPAVCDPGEGRGGASQFANCPGGLQGQRLAIAYPIYNPSLATLFRIEAANGDVLTELLPPDRLEWEVPQEPSLANVMLDYLWLGVEHIWLGIDHLLFVVGLLLLAATMRRVLLAVTGFTIAHSLTLSLSVLDLVRVPIAPVEAAIALSILFLAREIVRPDPDGLAARYPVLVASSFGLLHGFGFAAVLQDIGLPTRELAAGLFSFNLGVEIGQVAFILGALALFWLARRIAGSVQTLSFELQGTARLVAGYALGIPAALWFMERAGPILA